MEVREDNLSGESMALDLSFEELFRSDEITTLLKIDDEELEEIKGQGCHLSR